MLTFFSAAPLVPGVYLYIFVVGKIFEHDPSSTTVSYELMGFPIQLFAALGLWLVFWLTVGTVLAINTIANLACDEFLRSGNPA